MLYCAWLGRYHAGETPGSHPGENGDARYEELQALVQPRRVAPSNTRVLQAE
ncbi:hypothetical protein [Kutzneria sp. 744]|uniref:hypothetical protein n=1 Tax=Kutzneria sp. (strain 744) TaxID=345341 RepID=UPI0004B22FE3|nr:hypothetical protein [Kutzneria sp. 744]